MSFLSKILMLLVVLNGIQLLIVGGLLKHIASKMGKEVNIFTRDSQKFLLDNKERLSVEDAKLLRYSIIINVLEAVFFISLIISVW